MVELHWMGPYSLVRPSKHPAYSLVDEPPGFDGLYCWCVEVDGTFLPTYIGKSAGKTTGVVKRVRDEIKDALSGRYQQLLDANELRSGRRLVINERFPDAEEKKGQHEAFHQQHHEQYRAAVEVCVVFFARMPDDCGATIRQLEEATLARVQESGLDRRPAGDARYRTLLCNAPARPSVQVIHRCSHAIRGLTE